MTIEFLGMSTTTTVKKLLPSKATKLIHWAYLTNLTTILKQSNGIETEKGDTAHVQSSSVVLSIRDHPLLIQKNEGSTTDTRKSHTVQAGELGK